MWRWSTKIKKHSKRRKRRTTGEWDRSLKDGALGLISEGKKQYSIAQSGAVWCSMEAEVSVK
jgi:hypothetical protein